ncbi:hypothetical protein CWI42_090440 [Ordospora colligata]|uniref:Uncharacterized protein n=1 Tax=Ordospora colligata OC4 TaxID=1354746 RepID=A0A0B2UJG3_9MICR|nr:uncharacterized protein M896_090440 [Ordospora colligata OC4]KHN69120.1 hypothetical protein M896_090440 [Ordospora colligata OC4]TBU14575.1 hypothetical protein CWI41_090440 [Ordospora colligata]TBU14769.1 hypothetical protein CWI40_090450 [Ordospora colligata]TBU18203.1 hypothetical protein CWI42_090440 [Ordospora colligata]
MEKYSAYNDPLSGVNPFTDRKGTRYSILEYTKAILKIPFLVIMLVTNIDVVRYLITIRSNTLGKPRVLAANSSSFLDMHVLRHLTGIRNFYYVTETGYIDARSNKFISSVVEPCVLFPEACRTNNRAVLQFSRNVRVDYVCGIKYNGDCVNLYGNRFWFMLRFLASNCSVDVKFKQSTDIQYISKLSGLPQVIWSAKDKNRFVEEFTYGSKTQKKQ